jgi:hypothetical protein
MRIIALAGLALALSACGGNDSSSADEANALGADNLMMDDNLMLDANASMNGAGGMDANASTNASTENMMQKDAATNDPDTNLANGL